jgi:hypothetical protein
MFKPLELQEPINRPRFAKGQPFEFSMENILVDEMGSFIEGSKSYDTNKYTKVCERGSYKNDASK